MDFPSQLIPWLPFQMGVLPTDWPPTLAPQCPLVLESILASSPLDVSGFCCSLNSKSFGPLTMSEKLWVLLVKDGIKGLNSGVWGCPSCYVYSSHWGTPERPLRFVLLTVQELHWSPFPAYSIQELFNLYLFLLSYQHSSFPSDTTYSILYHSRLHICVQLQGLPTLP